MQFFNTITVLAMLGAGYVSATALPNNQGDLESLAPRSADIALNQRMLIISTELGPFVARLADMYLCCRCGMPAPLQWQKESRGFLQVQGRRSSWQPDCRRQ